MMTFDPEKYLGRKGYVKVEDGIYAYGEIRETGASGTAGYYAILEFRTKKGRLVKLCLEDIRELLKEAPRGVVILGDA